MTRQATIAQHGQSMSRVAGACSLVTTSSLPTSTYPTHVALADAATQRRNNEDAWNLFGKPEPQAAIT